jgi:predicted amidophosphoribosyltransferase
VSAIPEYEYRTWSIRTGPNQNHLEARSHTVLSRADLDQPACPSCYRPLRVASYCSRCEESGAAARHRDHPHRRMAS